MYKKRNVFLISTAAIILITALFFLRPLKTNTAVKKSTFIAEDMTEKGPITEDETKIIATVNEATIYMEHLDDYFPMGTLLKNEVIHLLDENNDWYIVTWGNGTGFIKTTEAKKTSQALANEPLQVESAHTVIYTVEDTPIYTDDLENLVAFGQLNAGFRYPVIQDYEDDWWVINVGDRKGYIAKQSAPIDQGIPVLMYHHILTPEEKANSPFATASTTITTVEFDEQMKYLHDEQYTTIKTEDLQAYLNREKNLPAKAILLTMDDGNISSRIYGYPILQKYALHVDQFMITNRTPKEPIDFNYQKLTFLSQQEMDDMTDHYSYHAHTHALHNLSEDNISFLLTQTDDDIIDDLTFNRELLNGTTYLAYPFGQYDEHAIELVKESGIELAFTTTGGYATLDTDPMRIPRLGIEPNVTLPAYIEKVKLPVSLLETATPIPSVQTTKNNIR